MFQPLYNVWMQHNWSLQLHAVRLGIRTDAGWILRKYVSKGCYAKRVGYHCLYRRFFLVCSKYCIRYGYLKKEQTLAMHMISNAFSSWTVKHVAVCTALKECNGL